MEWIFPEQNNKHFVDWIYEERGITNRAKLLSVGLEDLHDPFLLNDIKKGVAAVADALKAKQKIFIHGDFDVDGITATSLMWQYLYRDLGADVLPYIPSRFNEGYGLSEESLRSIIDQGGELVITVDCGVKDIELIAKYSDRLKFIITDHHSLRSETELSGKDGSKLVGDYIVSSKALAVIHPGIGDYPFKEICGAMVAWKFCLALNTYLKAGIDMTKYLDLVSLGTVCDVMPISDENWIAVKLGLEKMRITQNIGLKALMQVAKIDPLKVDAYHLGFVLGPRLNASGRLESAMDGVRLLTTTSKLFADDLARKLDKLNDQRRSLTLEYLEKAEEQLLERKDKLLLVYGDEWPEGIIGLIAGRLTEKYNRPVIVGSKNGNTIKASARSISAFNITKGLKEIEHLLERYGGHAQAAGLTFPAVNLSEIEEHLIQKANTTLSDQDLIKHLVLNASAHTKDLTSESVEDLNLLSPFGFMNPRPLLALRKVSFKNHKIIGTEGTHFKSYFSSTDGNEIEGLGFGLAERFNNEILASAKHTSTLLDVAGYVEVDSWNGYEKVVFKLKDFRFAQ